MDKFNELLIMGGYGEFIWPAYAVTLVVLVGLLVWSLRELCLNERTLRDLQSNGSEERKV